MQKSKVLPGQNGSKFVIESDCVERQRKMTFCRSRTEYTQ